VNETNGITETTTSAGPSGSLRRAIGRALVMALAVAVIVGFLADLRSVLLLVKLAIGVVYLLRVDSDWGGLLAPPAGHADHPVHPTGADLSRGGAHAGARVDRLLRSVPAAGGCPGRNQYECHARDRADPEASAFRTIALRPRPRGGYTVQSFGPAHELA
jgi:hypothetical protein